MSDSDFNSELSKNSDSILTFPISPTPQYKVNEVWLSSIL